MAVDDGRMELVVGLVASGLIGTVCAGRATVDKLTVVFRLGGNGNVDVGSFEVGLVEEPAAGIVVVVTGAVVGSDVFVVI